ncbi:MAG TPA: LdpA C-terminal domain-containing domain [Syntrophorhabdaceae bacterium]|nr:LdpA C-terminal domain-containing domain [Syntrophorhabdaceae bacterium]HQM80965.1 LdpA C-terminal domain-containing domain [Syntrophorhabdaceae bacterium]
MNAKNERYDLLKGLFQERRFFKLVCGAGNENLTEVRRLAAIYTIAGAAMHDLSANIDVVEAAKRGVEEAYALAPLLGKKIAMRPYLNVSIGLKGDPHVRKALIDRGACVECGECIKACRQEAISEGYSVEEFKCIGCGDCESVCPAGAIRYIHKRADFENILPECVRRGVETMELHGVTDDDEAVLHDWKLLNAIITDNFLSVCLDRSLLSNRHLIDRIRQLHEVTGERMIVQADGVPMSGEGDDYNTTLQAVACADVVMKSGIPVVVLLSGGTNSRTGLLARQCGVNAHGVSVGSFARKLVKRYVTMEDFDTNIDAQREAVSVAEELVRANLEAIGG